MSEHKHQAPVHSIERNEVKMDLVEHKILKGKRAETVYLAPPVTVENLSAVVKWIGDANLVNELSSLLKRKFQNIWFNAVEAETGVVNIERFLVDAANFTTSGMKLKDISDKLDELQASQTKIIMAGGWQGNPTTDGQPLAVDKSNISSAGKLQEQMQELNSQIRAYMAMKEDRQRKPKEEEEAEPAVTVG